MSTNFAKIAFRPICSNCGKELKQYIDAIKYPAHTFGEYDFVHIDYTLEPSSCPFLQSMVQCH